MADKLDLNTFITTAVHQVKTAKKKGKAGRKARQALGKDQDAFARTMQELQLLAKKAEQDAWKVSALIQLTTLNTCPCCKSTNTCSSGAIYVERVHKTLGRTLKDVSEFKGNIPPNIPHRIEQMFTTQIECLTCFMKQNPSRELVVVQQQRVNMARELQNDEQDNLPT